MKEDLGLYKNQLNYMQTCWTVGYVIGELPSNMILTRFRPSRWIPIMEMTWAVLTFCLARANSATTIYALRFFIGLAESTFYPGMQYIIGSSSALLNAVNELIIDRFLVPQRRVGQA